jgi:hypothetical protein
MRLSASNPELRSTERRNMNKPVKLACVVAAAMLAAPLVSFSQTAPADKTGYTVSPDRAVVKSGTGLCWRTGY